MAIFKVFRPLGARADPPGPPRLPGRHSQNGAMADNSLPNDNLPEAAATPAVPGAAQSSAVNERRAFLRRAAMIGLPVVIASIPSRTAWAQPKKPAGGGQNKPPKKPGGAALDVTAGCMASAHNSGCAGRTVPLL